LNHPDKNNSCLVTGVLGGLGSSLAARLLNDGFHVFGLDNFDPGSAPEIVHHYRLSLLQGYENFKFFALDLRNQDMHDSLFQETTPQYIIHCAGVFPFRPLLPDSSFLYENNLNLSETILNLTETYKIKKTIYLHHHYSKNSANANSHPLWEAILNAENTIQNEIDNHSLSNNIKIIKLHTLIGIGQSYRTFPFRQITQLISRVPVSVSKPGNALTISMNSATDTIVKQLSISKMDKEDSQSNNCEPISIDTGAIIRKLIKIIGIEPLGFKREVIPWTLNSSEKSDSHLTDEIENEVKDLVDWALQLPWMPPVDWSDKRKRVRSKRNNRTNPPL